jgi:hypothetical protein
MIERGPTKEQNDKKGQTKVKMSGIDPQKNFLCKHQKSA